MSEQTQPMTLAAISPASCVRRGIVAGKHAASFWTFPLFQPERAPTERAFGRLPKMITFDGQEFPVLIPADSSESIRSSLLEHLAAQETICVRSFDRPGVRGDELIQAILDEYHRGKPVEICVFSGIEPDEIQPADLDSSNEGGPKPVVVCVFEKAELPTLGIAS